MPHYSRHNTLLLSKPDEIPALLPWYGIIICNSDYYICLLDSHEISIFSGVFGIGVLQIYYLEHIVLPDWAFHTAFLFTHIYRYAVCFRSSHLLAELLMLAGHGYISKVYSRWATHQLRIMSLNMIADCLNAIGKHYHIVYYFRGWCAFYTPFPWCYRHAFDRFYFDIHLGFLAGYIFGYIIIYYYFHGYCIFLL